jgi:glycosyltransferase involved in cell wall biosynthesis
MPFFSVVIPLYNKADYISNCLKSALNQSFQDYEIIIINDGSTDSSISIVETFTSDKIKIIHQENSGASIARNNGVAEAKGTYIAFLDADDLWKTNHLQCLKNSIDMFPNAGLYANNYEIKYSKTHIIPAKLNIDILQSKPRVIDDFFKASIHDTLVWTSATVIKKNKFFDFGMFNIDYTTCEDLDLWIRIALKESIVFNPESTMIYNKSIEGSLGKTEDDTSRSVFLNSFTKYEDQNIYLNKYLDFKRYGFALRTKIKGESKVYKETLKSIDFKNLNYKQRLLLKTPTLILKSLNRIRPYVIKNRLYLKFFKG